MMGSKDPEKAVGRGEPKIVLTGKVAESDDLHRLRPSSRPEPQRLVPRFPPDPRAPDACVDDACCEGAPLSTPPAPAQETVPSLAIAELAWVSVGAGHSRITAHLSDGSRAIMHVPPEKRLWWLRHLLSVFFGGAGR